MKELSPHVRRIIERGSAQDGPGEGARQRNKAAIAAQLGLVSAAAAASTTAAAAGGKTGGLLAVGGWQALVKAGLLGAVVGAATLGTAHYAGIVGAERRGAPTPPTGGGQASTVVASSAPAPSASSADPPAATRTSVVVGAGRAVAPAPSSVGAASIGDEVRLLREVHQALQAGQPARALQLIDAYQGPASTPALAEARAAARAIALCQAGRRVEGQNAREAFLRSHAGSLFAERVDAACGQGGGGNEQGEETDSTQPGH